MGVPPFTETPIWVQHLIFFEDMFWEALCGTTTPLNQRWELSEAEGLSYHLCWKKMGVSLNGGTPKSSILLGFSIINHPFWGYPYFWKHPIRGERILKTIQADKQFCLPNPFFIFAIHGCKNAEYLPTISYSI